MSAGDSLPEGHPDRLRWNAKYAGGFVPSFTPHQLAVLTKVIEISERDRDALPGSAVKLVKAARRIMLKRRKP